MFYKECEPFAIFGHETDSSPQRFRRRSETHRLSVQQYFAALEWIIAKDCPRHFGSTCTDEPCETNNFSSSDRQVYAIERHSTRVATSTRETADFQDRPVLLKPFTAADLLETLEATVRRRANSND